MKAADGGGSALAPHLRVLSENRDAKEDGTVSVRHQVERPDKTRTRTHARPARAIPPFMLLSQCQVGPRRSISEFCARFAVGEPSLR